MALKQQLTKAQFDALPDALKSEYKVDPANAEVYKLDIEDFEDPGELRRARDREKQAAKDAAAERDRLKAELDEAKRNGSRSKGDIAELEKSWKDAKEAAIAAKDAVIAKKDGVIKKTFVQSKALEMAQRISTSPNLILPHILSRLSVDTDADEPVTRVLSADGKPSAASLAELEQEFVANKEFAAIIKASSASGGGASGNSSGGGAPNKKPEEMSESERAKLARDNPAKFRELFPQAVY